MDKSDVFKHRRSEQNLCIYLCASLLTDKQLSIFASSCIPLEVGACNLCPVRKRICQKCKILSRSEFCQQKEYSLRFTITTSDRPINQTERCTCHDPQ